MRITVVRTSATTAEVTDLTPVTPLTPGTSEVVVVSRPAVPRPRPRVVLHQGRRSTSRRAGRSAAHGSRSELVEVIIVRSTRNRAGGGARARPLR